MPQTRHAAYLPCSRSPLSNGSFAKAAPRTSQFYGVAQLPLAREGLELELLHLAEIASHPSRDFEQKYYIRTMREFSNSEDFPKVSQPNHRPLLVYDNIMVRWFRQACRIGDENPTRYLVQPKEIPSQSRLRCGYLS
jgi:hypothetical protein